MPSGGSGLYSTANDYAKVLVALLSGGGGLLKPEPVQQLRDAQLPDNKYLMEQFYGSWHDALYPKYPLGMLASYGLGRCPESRGHTPEATKGELDVERGGKYALGASFQLLRM